MKLKNLFPVLVEKCLFSCNRSTRLFLSVVMIAMFTAPSTALAQSNGQAVATVQSLGQNPVEYTDLEAAFAAAQNNDEIKLLADCALAADATHTGKLALGDGSKETDVVLDLNGHTISGTADELITVTANALLRIIDGGTGGSIVTTGAKCILSVGKLYMSRGSVAGATSGVYSRGAANISGGTVSGGSYALYIEQGVANIGGGTFVATGTDGIGIESGSANGFYILGMPTFNCTVADISLAKDQKLEFAPGSFAKPEKKIRVKVANDAPYTFTKNYDIVKDVDDHSIDPEDFFVSADYGEGLIGSIHDSYTMLYEAAIAGLTEVTFQAGTSTYFDQRALALYGTNDNLKFYGIKGLSGSTVQLAEFKSKKFGENSTVIVSNTSSAAIIAKMVVAFEGPMASSFVIAANADLDLQEFPPIFLDGTEDALTEIPVPSEDYEVFGFSDNSFVLLGSDATAAAHSGWLVAEKSKLPAGVSRLSILWPDGTTTGYYLEASWISLADGPFVYDGTAKEPAVTVTDNGTDVTNCFEWSYKNNVDAHDATGNDAPTVTVTAKTSQTKYIGSASKTFAIARKPVTVKADKQKKYAHAEDPTLTATVSGLVDADKDKAGIIDYTVSRAEGEKVGTYDITAQGDAEQGNYSVSYEGAKLYILHAPSPYGVWVNELAVTADNRLDILGDGDAASKKAPSVQYFDKEGLLVLTNATVDIIESDGDLEIYLAPESDNKVGCIRGEINDPQDPDENVAQTRTETFIIIGGRLLIVDTDGNFPGSIDFTTNRATVGGYDDVAISSSLVCFDAKGRRIDESALAEGGENSVAAIEGKDKVTDEIDVNASALAGAIAAEDIEAGDNVKVSLRAEDGAISVTATKTGAAGDEGSIKVTDAAGSVSVHLQNYGQEGGDKVKEDGNGNVLSFKGEPGAEPIYRLYNPNSGEHFYTRIPSERDALKAQGWRWEDILYAGGAIDGASASSVSGDFPSGASVQTAAGSTEINVVSEENGDATLGAVIDVTGDDLSGADNLIDVLNSIEPVLTDDTDETGEDSGDEGDGPGEDPVDDGNEDKPVFEIQGTVLKKYHGQDKKCTIPRSVKTIGKSAFSGCTSITTLILPNKVTTIDPKAFSGCTNLKKVSRGQKSRLRTIKRYAFQGCISLTDFNLSNVKKINKKAFKDCNNFNVSKNKTNKRVYRVLPVAVEAGPGGRKTTRITVNSSEPTTVVLFKESAAIGGSKTRGDGNNAEESELLIHNIQITPRKIYACNSIAEVTGGEYVGLENIQQELPGQKVTGDDADLPKPGDVNGDDVVNAVDVVMTNNHIKGFYSSIFCESAADQNDDYTIDQDDVDEMVNLILNKK